MSVLNKSGRDAVGHPAAWHQERMSFPMQSQSITPPTFGDPRLPERLWRKTELSDSECWEWQGWRGTWGHGYISVGSAKDGTNRLVLVHRLAYETLVGPIPEGLEIDHLCRNPCCLNPSHLQPVTHRENLDRSPFAWWHKRRALTHCPQGHPYDAQNTIWRYDHRYCRACKAVDQKRRRRVRAEERRKEKK